MLNLIKQTGTFKADPTRPQLLPMKKTIVLLMKLIKPQFLFLGFLLASFQLFVNFDKRGMLALYSGL